MRAAAFLRFLILATLAAAAGCASNGRAPRFAEGQVRNASAPLVEADIARTSTQTAFEAIQQLRPQYLLGARVRGAVDGPVVYVDGIRVGGIEALNNIVASTIGEIRRLDLTEATIRFGSGHADGAILVATKR